MKNVLHQALAAKILRFIRTRGLAPQHHLTEAALQEHLAVSRGPIRAAMLELTASGILERRQNRGFFVLDPQRELAAPPEDAADDEQIYLAIADDRLMHSIPDTVSEPLMMERYGLTRVRLRRILSRIASEGWIERREGRGWTFAMLVDSVEAYRESYEMRQMIEPAGLLGDRFRLDSALLSRLRDQQAMVRDGGWQSLSQIELFETNSVFHEGLAEMSGNRYLLGTVQRLNQLRRLVEYRQTLRRDQVRQQNIEHLEIIGMLEHGDRQDAAAALSMHLGNAKRRKADSSIFQEVHR